jgi:hypothetical protein
MENAKFAGLQRFLNRMHSVQDIHEGSCRRSVKAAEADPSLSESDRSATGELLLGAAVLDAEA